MDQLVSFAQAVIAIFIEVDPFGNILIFIGLTEKPTPSQRNKIDSYSPAVFMKKFYGRLISNRDRKPIRR